MCGLQGSCGGLELEALRGRDCVRSNTYGLLPFAQANSTARLLLAWAEATSAQRKKLLEQTEAFAKPPAKENAKPYPGRAAPTALPTGARPHHLRPAGQ